MRPGLAKRRRRGRGIFGDERRTPAALEPLEGRTLFALTAFQIDPALSQIRLSGEAYSIDLDEQADGSLSARYEGTILADVDGDSIRFVGGSTIAAQSRGSFDPRGGPANYAGEANGPFGIDLGEVAVRGLVLDVTSSADLPLTGGTSFASRGAAFEVTAGDLFYDTRAGSGDEDLAGTAGPNRTAARSSVVVTAPGTGTLTIPIDVELDESGADLRLRGRLVATALGTNPIIDANGPTDRGTGFATAFVVGQGEVVAAVAADALTVGDADDATLASGRVTLTNPLDGAAERVSVTTAGTGITAGPYDAATGVLTLTGNSSVANYQSALRTLRYQNEADDPTVGDRTITLTLNDGDADGPAATSVVNVRNPNVAALGAGGSRSVAFADADGTVATLSLAGPGTARLRFTGAAEQVASRRGATISGTNVALAAVEVTGSTLLSRLTVKTTRGGDGAVTVGGLTSDGSLGSVGGRSVDLAGTLAVDGTIGRADVRNVAGATIAAGSILRLAIAGAMTDSTVTLTDSFNAVVPALGTFAVTGLMTGSRVTAAGNVGAVQVGGMADSQIYAGRAGTDVFPDNAGDFAADPVTIAKVTLGTRRSAGPTFDNSVVAARNFGTVSLGRVDTDNADNGGAAFGVVADRFASLSATDAAGQRLKLRRLDDPADLQSAVLASGFALGDLEIRVVS